MPDWPVQRVRREQKTLARRPLVFSASDGRTERVVSCSREARQLGIQIGMRTPDAESLAGPGRLALLNHEPAADRRMLVRLATDCERFSPTVALEEADSPEALLLDLRGLALLWGGTRAEGERRLAEAARRWLLENQLVGAVAIAGTASLALAVARHGDPAGEGPAPAGGVVDNASSVLDRLPVETLRTDDATLQRLYGLGIDTVGVLLTLPRSALPARFGQELTRRLGQLLGDIPEPLIPIREASAIRADWPFDTAVRSGEVLAATTRRLMEPIAAELHLRGHGALRVLINYELESSDHQGIPVALRLFRPTACAKELQELAELHTESLRFPAAVKTIRVLVGSSAPLDVRQRTLFEDKPQDCPYELTKLINRLANRVGYDRVSRVEQRKSVDPARTYSYAPATDTPARRFKLTDHQAAKLRSLPLSLASSDLQRGVVVVNRDGTPAVFGNARVVRCWGPERVETGWWRGRGVRRDAYWVELEDGCRLWLCRDLRGGRWRLAGEFA